jgi:hypothetical protein
MKLKKKPTGLLLVKTWDQLIYGSCVYNDNNVRGDYIIIDGEDYYKHIHMDTYPHHIAELNEGYDSNMVFCKAIMMIGPYFKFGQTVYCSHKGLNDWAPVIFKGYVIDDTNEYLIPDFKKGSYFLYDVVVTEKEYQETTSISPIIINDQTFKVRSVDVPCVINYIKCLNDGRQRESE